MVRHRNCWASVQQPMGKAAKWAQDSSWEPQAKTLEGTQEPFLDIAFKGPAHPQSLQGPLQHVRWAFAVWRPPLPPAGQGWGHGVATDWAPLPRHSSNEELMPGHSTCSLINLFGKHLLSICCMPGIVLGLVEMRLRTPSLSVCLLMPVMLFL